MRLKKWVFSILDQLRADLFNCIVSTRRLSTTAEKVGGAVAGVCGLLAVWESKILANKVALCYQDQQSMKNETQS